MKKLDLTQMPNELRETLQVNHKESILTDFKFTCQGKLNNYKGYEKFYKNLWLWSKIEDDQIFTVVTADLGNKYYHTVYVDVYVKEIVDEINSNS